MERKPPVFTDDAVELNEACGLSWEELQAQRYSAAPHVPTRHAEENLSSSALPPSDLPTTASSVDQPSHAREDITKVIRNPLTESEMMYIVEAISPVIEARVEELVLHAVEEAMLQTKTQLDQTLKLHIRDAILSTLKRVDISSD